MDFVKPLWPTPFKVKEKDIGSLVIQLIIFLVVCAVVGVLLSVLSGIAIIGPVFWIVGSLMEVYSIVGIVLCVLKFLGAVK